MSDYDYLYKILIIGDSGVGKSSILMRFTDDSFTGQHISTIGVDFKVGTIIHNHKRVKLQIWDTAGQERFSMITNSYYKGAQGIVIVFDWSNYESFRHVEKWLKCVNENVKKDCEIILIGNKSDLPKSLAIEWLNVANLINDHNLTYLEVSAKEGTNITTIFEKMVSKLVGNKLIANHVHKNIKLTSMKLIEEKKNKRRCC